MHGSYGVGACVGYTCARRVCCVGVGAGAGALAESAMVRVCSSVALSMMCAVAAGGGGGAGPGGAQYLEEGPVAWVLFNCEGQCLHCTLGVVHALATGMWKAPKSGEGCTHGVRG